MSHTASKSDADFTQSTYAHLLDIAAQHYEFRDFGEMGEDRPFVIWRHDVDYSPHRALALAKLEHQRGLKCVYHVLLTGSYYNPLEPDIAAIFAEISSMGHAIGLHLDMDVFGQTASVSQDAILARIRFEKDILEQVVGCELRSMSFHNYGMHQERVTQAETLGGMINIAAPGIRDGFKYVSDSNGIWRYDRLDQVLKELQYEKLHVLTHPEWWTPEALSPIDRLDRCINGRAEAGRAFYVNILKRDGRYNEVAADIGLQAEKQ